MQMGIACLASTRPTEDVALVLDFCPVGSRAVAGKYTALQAATRRGPVPTWSGASTRTLFDSAGVLVFAPHNLQIRSETFDHAAWVKNDITVTANTATAPDGELTADTLAPTTANDEHFIRRNGGDVNSLPWTFSVKAKADGHDIIALGNNFPSGAGNQRVAWFNLTAGTVGSIDDNSTGDVTASIVDEGDGWWRCIVETLSVPGNKIFDIAISDVDNNRTQHVGVVTNTVFLSGAQQNQGVLTDYVPTTDAFVFLPRIGAYTPISGAADLGFLPEGARTHSGLHNRDQTNAAWVKSNMTTAKDATGLDSVASSASTLTASDANATSLQTVTISSAAFVFAVYVKRKTGTGDIDITDNNGTNWTTLTGLSTTLWTRHFITRTQANPVFGIRIVTDTDAIEVDFANLENGIYPTSANRTTTAAVVRAADVAETIFGNFGTLQGTLYAEATLHVNTDENRHVASINNNSSGQAINVGLSTAGAGSPKGQMSGETPSVALTAGSTWIAGTTIKMAIAYQIGLTRFFSRGVANASPVDVSDLPDTPDRLTIGSADGGGQAFSDHISRVAVRSHRPTNEYLVTRTA